MTPVQTAPSVTPIEERGYAHPEVLVSTEWVAQHLNDPPGKSEDEHESKQRTVNKVHAEGLL